MVFLSSSRWLRDILWSYFIVAKHKVTEAARSWSAYRLKCPPLFQVGVVCSCPPPTTLKWLLCHKHACKHIESQSTRHTIVITSRWSLPLHRWKGHDGVGQRRYNGHIFTSGRWNRGDSYFHSPLCSLLMLSGTYKTSWRSGAWEMDTAGESGYSKEKHWGFSDLADD